MKDSKSTIIDSIAEKGEGMKVPAGYFEDFALKMSASLPFREELDVPVSKATPARSSRWMRVRPYVYMAAMFAGAWCLLKMFSLMSPASTEISIDNYPALSRALENEQFIDEYVIDGVSSYDMLEESYLQSIGDDDTDDPDIEIPVADEDNVDYILPTDGNYSSIPQP